MSSMRFLNEYMTVDGGWNTGIANWHKGSIHPETAVIATPVDQDLDPQDKLDYCANNFDWYLHKWKPAKCAIESLHVWSGSARSMASWESEDNIYLCYLIGRYIQMCRQNNIHVYLLRPIDWKGTMNDEMVALRVHRRNGFWYKDIYGQYWSHVTDAVGIGLSIMGVF